MRCYFEDRDAGPCDGRIIRAHVVSKQLLRREYPLGAVLDDMRWRPLTRHEDAKDFDRFRSLKQIQNDPRCWVPCCGGLSGLAGHHAQLDTKRTLKIPRDSLPAHVETFCEDYGLEWYLDRMYGPKPVTNGSRPLKQDT